VNFFCFDVETANESASSICQIGIAAFIEGRHEPKFDIEMYVDPEDYFLEELTCIHGITEKMVSGAPTFPAVHQVLNELLSGRTVLGHSHFDRVSLNQATARYGLQQITPLWLDTLRVARRAWPERRGNGGHGLSALADLCGIQFRHHSALQDAWCAGMVFLQACEVTGLSLEQWLERVEQPVSPLKPLHAEGNPEGHLFGEVVVFTGQLSLPRREMAEIAALAGCCVEEGVTKHTTLVIVGVQDVKKLHGAEISGKHQKARDLIAKGKPLRVMSESDFQLILKN
jgi:DNA polymerase-3 subunit epsilon